MTSSSEKCGSPDPGAVCRIFKILRRSEWEGARDSGVFNGSPVDHDDGFIHFSAADQVAATAALHFTGVDDLVLVAVDAGALGDKLAWEPSRGGALFPHLYGPLPLSATLWAIDMPLGPDGVHQLPDLTGPGPERDGVA